MPKIAISVSWGVWLFMCGCTSASDTPPTEWANAAPTVVERVVNRGNIQLLEIRQGRLTTWARVPMVDALVGDYILLTQGTARSDVEIPELGITVPQVVDIQHARVVDLETAKRAVLRSAPENAVAIETVYSELDQRTDQQIVVYGTVVRAPGAIGWYWVHLRDGTGSSEEGTHDLTVKTKINVTEGQRGALRGLLRKDVDLGFGYHYRALVEEGELVTEN